MPTQTIYSVKILEQLRKDISQLTYNEHCEIFNIIRKDNEKISENNNGVFINLKYLKNETLLNLVNFVKYCNNRKILKLPVIGKVKLEKESTNMENLYNKFNTLQEESYKVYNINDSPDEDICKKMSPIEPIKSNLNSNLKKTNNKFNGIKERIYKKCITKNIDNNDIASNISSKQEESEESSNEYLKI